MNKEPIYQYIDAYLKKQNIEEGGIMTLGRGFSLPKEKSEGLNFADGAMDGISIYHMGTTKMSQEDKDKLLSAYRSANQGDYEKADEILDEVCSRVRVVNCLDDLQRIIIDNSQELEAPKMYKYAVHLLLDSSSIESVKAGIMIFELFNIDEAGKKAIRTLGLSDEFTLYSVFLMRRWDNGNTEIMNLAKGVDGWGKIHAVCYIEPETEEIRHWLLTDGVNNGVLAAYSGLVCYQKAGVEELLDKPELTYEEIKGILGIIDAMLDEGPVQGISVLDNPKEILAKVLKKADEQEVLQKEEQDVIKHINEWLEDNQD